MTEVISDRAAPIVLYIDDDEANRRLMVKLLERRRPDYAVVTAATGGEGREAATRQRPDIVLLDVNLPDIGGEDILAALRTELDVPIVMVTGEIDEERSDRLIRAGAAAYVTKPFDVAQLIELIDELVGRRFREVQDGERS